MNFLKPIFIQHFKIEELGTKTRLSHILENSDILILSGRVDVSLQVSQHLTVLHDVTSCLRNFYVILKVNAKTGLSP